MITQKRLIDHKLIKPCVCTWFWEGIFNSSIHTFNFNGLNCILHFWNGDYIWGYCAIIGRYTGLKVQRNRNNHKEYPVLRNIPIPFTRIGIGFSNIPILFNRSRIAFLNILYLQNLYRILQNMKMQENLSWKALYIKYCKYNFSRITPQIQKKIQLTEKEHQLLF